MSPDKGGAFATLINLVRLGLGGASGSGKQFVSWIHDADFARAIDFLIANSALDGAVNIAAPNPLPNRDFMAAMRRAYGTPIGLPATDWMLEVGSFVLRTESELVLKSRRVVPRRLLEAGFAFGFPDWTAAAADLVQRIRRRRSGREKGR
jgi:NAD dependent epimerase/dehydratase family enzyme